MLKILIILAAFALADITVPVVNVGFDTNYYGMAPDKKIIQANTKGDTVWSFIYDSITKQAFVIRQAYHFDGHARWWSTVDSFTVPETKAVRQANGDTTWAVAFCVYADTVYSALKCYRKLASNGTVQLDGTKIYRGSVLMAAFASNSTEFDSAGVNHFRLVGTKTALYYTSKVGYIGKVDASGKVFSNTNRSLGCSSFSDGIDFFFRSFVPVSGGASIPNISKWTSATTKTIVINNIPGNATNYVGKFGIDFNDTTIYYANGADSNYLWVYRHGVSSKIANGFKVDSFAEFTWQNNHLWYRNRGDVVKFENNNLFVKYNVQDIRFVPSDTNIVAPYNAYVINEDSILTRRFLAELHRYSAPVINAVSTDAPEKALYSVTLTATGDYGLNYSALVKPSWLTLAGSTLSGTPVQANVGDTVVSIMVADTVGSSDTLTYTLHITNVNDAPVLAALRDTTINENETITFTALATDVDGDAITYTWNVPNPFTAAYADSGVRIVTVIASDGSLTDTTSLTLTIHNVNRAPVLDAITNKNVAEGDTVKITANGIDLDGDALTYSWFVNTVAYSTDALFTLPTTFNDSGLKTVSCIVSDGSLTDTVTFTVTIGNSNRAPLVTARDTIIVECDTLDLVKCVSGVDLDGDIVMFSFSVTSPMITDYSDSGLKAITVIGSDGMLTDTAVFNVRVLNKNRKPVIINKDTLISTIAGYATFTLSVTDADNDNIIYSSINGKTTTITNVDSIFSIVKTSVGYDTVSFIVTDGIDTTILTITIYRAPSTGIEKTIPVITFCGNASPNPFNPTTAIAYGVAKPSNVMIAVYNLRGQLIKTLVNNNRLAGYYTVSWNASNISSGVYVLKTVIGSYNKISKLFLSK